MKDVKATRICVCNNWR